MKKQMRIGAYLRVSTTDQSTRLQRQEITAYLKARGWKTVERYDDSGKSGTHTNRPELRRLLEDARQRKIDLVITWKLDRFFRSLRDLVVTIQEWNELGVEFISIKDQVDLTTSTGRSLLQMLGAFAEFEASLIRERVRAGIQNAKAMGKRLGRPRSEKRDDDAIVKLRNEGKSLGAIAKELGVTKGLVQRALATVSKSSTKQVSKHQ